MEPEAQLKARKQLERAIREIGKSEAVERFIRSFGNVRVKALYASHLSLYFRWLKNKTPMTHDELLPDNLRCIYKSQPEDVATKRKHRAWLEEYVNESMKGRSHSYRVSLSQAVLGFYGGIILHALSHRNSGHIHAAVAAIDRLFTRNGGYSVWRGDSRDSIQAQPGLDVDQESNDRKYGGYRLRPQLTSTTLGTDSQTRARQSAGAPIQCSIRTTRLGILCP